MDSLNEEVNSASLRTMVSSQALQATAMFSSIQSDKKKEEVR